MQKYADISCKLLQDKSEKILHMVMQVIMFLYLLLNTSE